MLGNLVEGVINGRKLEFLDLEFDLAEPNHPNLSQHCNKKSRFSHLSQFLTTAALILRKKTLSTLFSSYGVTELHYH